MEKLLFYKGLDPLTSTSYHIEDNPIEDFRRRFEENIHSGKLESLKLDLQVKFGEYHIAYNVYDRLYIAEDVRRWNFEVEAKYSHLPLVRSMLIASQLSNYEELLLDGMPAKRFHQILNLIVLLFIECRGKFTQDKLYDLLQEKYKDRKSEVDIGSLKSDIDSVLYKLLCNDINASYKTFEKYLKKNFLYPPYYLNPFYTTPILSQEIGGIIEYFAPSPYILILSTGWLFWILVKDKINNNDLGTALHNYISAFLNHYKTIHNIDIIDLDKSNVNNSWKDLKKKADFVVETEHYKIIIECKNSLGFRTPLDKNSEDLSSLFNSWNRITKAIEQCNSTKSRLPCENKRIFNLIVVNEVVRGEAAAYIGFYDTNSFNKLELKWGEFSIISIAQFEYIVASNKLEEFIEECDLQSRKMVPRPHYDDIRKALNIL